MRILTFTQFGQTAMAVNRQNRTFISAIKRVTTSGACRGKWKRNSRGRKWRGNDENTNFQTPNTKEPSTTNPSAFLFSKHVKSPPCGRKLSVSPKSGCLKFGCSLVLGCWCLELSLFPHKSAALVTKSRRVILIPGFSIAPVAQMDRAVVS